MKVYGSNAIRNVAFVGHGASGKTSLVDALAWVAGSSRRHGNIKDGTTLTDYFPDEIDRKHSINLAVGFAEWLDTKINLIDTPGYLDYFGEVVTGLHAADAAVVVSGTGGVEVGTEKVWEVCDHLHLPRMLFVSMMDKEHADFERVYQDIRAHLTPKVVPVEIPIGDGPAFHGIINLFSGHCHNYKKGTAKSEYDVVPIPEEYQRRYQDYSEQLTEAVASTDDELIERYQRRRDSREQFIGAVKRAMLAGQIVLSSVGAPPSPTACGRCSRRWWSCCPRRPRSGRRSRRRWSAGCSRPCPKRTWATSPCSGFMPVSSGTAKSVERGARGGGEAEPPVHPAGQGADRVERLSAGDIGSVAKLRDTHTGDTFCHRDQPVRLPPLPLPEAVATSAVLVKQRGEEDKLAAGLHKLHEEDPTFHSVQLGAGADAHPRDGGAALHHPEPAGAQVRRARGADPTEGGLPRDAQGKGEGQGKHKKQTGGRGQYGDCWVRLSSAQGRRLRLRGRHRGRSHPQQIHPGGGQGDSGGGGAWSRSRLSDGGLPGRVLRRLLPRRRQQRDVIQDGRHPGLQKRRVEVPTGAARAAGGPRGLDARGRMGDVMGDLSSRRGQILGTRPMAGSPRCARSCPKPSSTSTPPRCTPSPMAGAPTGSGFTGTPRRRPR